MQSRYEDPITEVRRLQKQVNRLFDHPREDYDFDHGRRLRREPLMEHEKECFNPHMDIRERENDFLIHAELPGVNKKDISITLDHDGNMVICGEKKRIKHKHKHLHLHLHIREEDEDEELKEEELKGERKDDKEALRLKGERKDDKKGHRLKEDKKHEKKA